MLKPGVYPAAVTPFDEKGRIDLPSVARLLAWFEASGCTGAVLAGTNGEGPSLSAVEKRDLLFAAHPLRGKLQLILGVATPSLDEAVWLCKRAAEVEAPVLLMPPYYFRPLAEQGVRDWFLHVLDRSPTPVIIYNFPQRTGFEISGPLMQELASHENMAGAKDSSGNAANLQAYAPIGKPLFVGDETLLLQAMEAGWSGSISGAANVIPQWLSQIASEWLGGEKESAEAKFALAIPCIAALRSSPQPAMNKALLAAQGVITRKDVRLPLLPAEEDAVKALQTLITSRLG